MSKRIFDMARGFKDYQDKITIKEVKFDFQQVKMQTELAITQAKMQTEIWSKRILDKFLDRTMFARPQFTIPEIMKLTAARVEELKAKGLQVEKIEKDIEAYTAVFLEKGKAWDTSYVTATETIKINPRLKYGVKLYPLKVKKI